MIRSDGARVRRFAALLNVANVFERVARGVLYLAAGTLGYDDLQELAKREWQDFNCRDEEVLGGLMWWERDVYDRFLKASDRILIVGSGSGRDLIALVEAGHDVVGLEPSPPSVTLARHHLRGRARSADLIEGAIEDTDLPGTFDVVIFSFYCYSYIPGTARRIGALRKVRDHLNAGGRIVISYRDLRAPFRNRAIWLTRAAARVTKSDWRPEAHDVLTRLSGQNGLLHFEHRFTPEELEHEAREAGLDVTYHRQSPKPTTAVLVVQPRKEGASDR